MTADSPTPHPPAGTADQAGPNAAGMAERYDTAAIEAKWQARWRAANPFAVPVGELPSQEEKYYLLEMFPYPSGEGLHMGHTRVYTIGDALAKFHHMRGKRVMRPMGFDAFGLPAENAALKHGTHPWDWTERNMARFKEQMETLGWAYDWSREAITCHPDYYRWTQWLFLRFYERGLAYRKQARVNWCPSCNTTLANEQVVADACERCGTLVTKRELEQWYYRITQYAEELLSGLDNLAGWPESVKALQRNWIGRSEGLEAAFPLVSRQGSVAIFTTRPDTLYGVTYLVLAPEHPLVAELIPDSPDPPALRDFIAEMQRLKDFERTADEAPKRGLFTGAFCKNPATGEPVPIWVANYVLPDYGTGAVMAVPAHDQRDFEFAQAYGLPVTVVIDPPDGALSEPLSAAYTDAGIMREPSDFAGRPSGEFKLAIMNRAEREGWGRRVVQWRLRDWLLSRQRYWGCPIPVVYCEGCGIVPVPDDQLPVMLPRDVEFRPTGQMSPLATAPEFLHTACPECGGAARRETDTMDTFVDSSWYFVRYCDPQNTALPADPARTTAWLPVDCYIGGIEHAILHLMYFRFFTKVMRDLGLITPDEPATVLLSQGMVIYGGQKMSKSKGNTVDPLDLIRDFSADAVRTFILFAAPPDAPIDWADHVREVHDDAGTLVRVEQRGADASQKFMSRIWRTLSAQTEALSPHKEAMAAVQPAIADAEFAATLHGLIQEITLDFEPRRHLNTVVSGLMKALNAIEEARKRGASDADLAAGIGAFLRLLAPIAPHMAEELWERCGHGQTIFASPWPVADTALLAAQTVTCVIQVNGKVRDNITVAPDIAESELVALARTAKIEASIGEASVRKVIARPPSLVNFVVG